MKTVPFVLALFTATSTLQANSVTTNSNVVESTFSLSKNNDTTTKLEWSNSNLQAGESYAIEHSHDGNYFSTISQFPYELISQYDNIIYIHQTPSNGENYYQLVKNDSLGKATWKSKRQSISFDLPAIMANLSVKPSELEVQFKLLNTNQVKVKILDKNGTIKATFFAKGEIGTNHFHIPNTQLNDDAFMLSIEIPDFKVYRKIPLKLKKIKTPRA